VGRGALEQVTDAKEVDDKRDVGEGAARPASFAPIFEIATDGEVRKKVRILKHVPHRALVRRYKDTAVVVLPALFTYTDDPSRALESCQHA